MPGSFTHLHVASGYSLRYGASTPGALVEAAAGQGMSALALTDRDGLYGAVKFVQACGRAGIAPILGVDLAVRPSDMLDGLPTWAVPRAPVRRSPVRGGAVVDHRFPRVTVLALGRDDTEGRPAGGGYGRLCRLISAAQLAGERSAVSTSLEQIAAHALWTGASGTTCRDSSAAGLVVMLGPASEMGRAALARRPDLALAVLRMWQQALPSGSLVVEIVCHRGPDSGPASRSHAARMLAVAREAGIPAVLSNAVRYVDPADAATADVLDAARRLVPLRTEHLDRVNAEGYLKAPELMRELAGEVARAAGDEAEASALLAQTEHLARRCTLDPRADVGLGTMHFPEGHVLGLGPGESADRMLRERAVAKIGARFPGASDQKVAQVMDRVDTELTTITGLGYAPYFLTVADVCQLIRQMDVRVAARGSGAGSLVNYLLGISGVDPLRYNLMMERFLSPLRAQLPDIDVDVESARRTEVYERILDRFGAERVTCVSMMETYRVRHAIRDVGAALSLPPTEIDEMAKAFPHIRARNARQAIAELPELRARGLDSARLDLLFDLVERLDSLPRHVALHPCGVILSHNGLLDRTPVEASWQGFPMSQFDKDDVEAVGFVKLDVLGVRMQSAMAYAIAEVERVDGPTVPYADPATGRIVLDQVPHDDEKTFELICSTKTLGCFQIESPGQRELIGKFAPETFEDLIIDISLFRPGPVKSDMITPFLRARHGWADPEYLHPDLIEVLKETCGVVVFHEQVLGIVAEVTGCTLSEADEVRRALGSPIGQEHVEAWFRPLAAARGYDPVTVQRIWEVLAAFASFGFCKAHAAAFALPTYHSAWLKAHHPAAFLAGVLTHDPGMYPKRLILDDARSLGIEILPLDVNVSDETYRVEKTDGGYGIRLSLADVKGISAAEIGRAIAARPYHSLADFWQRTRLTRPVVERLVLAAGFDALYGLNHTMPVRGRDQITRRDLLLQVAELDRWSRSMQRSRPKARSKSAGGRLADPGRDGLLLQTLDVRAAATRQGQSQAVTRPMAELVAEQSVQLALDFGDAPYETVRSGLPEMTQADRVQAELEILGLDASAHVVDFYAPMLRDLGITRSNELLDRRSRSELLVAGVKVATQTPPVRSGRRVIFLTLDDSTGPVDATFFEDVQGPYASTVFHSWLLVVRGELRRTGPRGVSLRATGAWELPALWDQWNDQGPAAVLALIEASRRPGERRDDDPDGAGADPAGADPATVGADGRRRVLVHPSGFRQSPYADVRPAGEDVRDPRRKLWHASPGSAGR
jgi:error-prone DNA polymerase